MCEDPNAVFDDDDGEECHCLGDTAGVTEAQNKEILDKICRNTSLKGLDFVKGSMTPPSAVRCGTTNLNNITKESICFCDSPREQASRKKRKLLRN